ncbi:MAG: TIGR02452 family protein [Planctomycetales bacterium]
MSRSFRTVLARETVEIVEEGYYRNPAGRNVEIGPAVTRCLNGTCYFSPVDLQRLTSNLVAEPSPKFSTKVEVVNETTLEGVTRLLAEGEGAVAALNFASAKHPGGGFLTGAQAQEESLARSSALYASLLKAPEFYGAFAANPTPLYSDGMILSPACPVFRTDDGGLLEQPQLVTFITAAAPNAGAIQMNRPGDMKFVPETLRRRSEYVLAIAAAQGYRRLVLGAWGCGVFRNDPRTVATIFADHLVRGPWQGRFERVLFSVLDSSLSKEIIKPFQQAFASANKP